jgi:hypothetical protein
VALRRQFGTPILGSREKRPVTEQLPNAPLNRALLFERIGQRAELLNKVSSLILAKLDPKEAVRELSGRLRLYSSPLIAPG